MGDAEAVYEFLRVVQATLPAERLSAAVNEILRTSSLPAGIDRSMIERLPEAPGVYLFFGRDGELLYVGKSKNIKGRVLAHFSQDHRSGKELEMCQAVNSIEARPTAGELGALLLESRLIKELRPLFNSMARRIRKLVAASMRMNKQGYAVISLEEVESINPHRGAPVMGVFRSMKLGREFLERITKSHRLCPKLLGLERAKEHCFAYQLKQCDGACVGEEPADAYNARVEAAFAERRIRTWPYRGGVVIEEKGGAAGEGEVFLVDQWCLLSSLKYSRYGTECRPQQNPTFDYDSYKILLRYLLNRVNRKNIRVVARGEFDRLVQTLEDSAGAGA
jgi:DNA polymerase-3 subunit epsilon